MRARRCGRCRRFGREFAFARAAGCWEYGATVRRLVHRFKYSGRRDLLAPLGRRMAQDPRIGAWLAASRQAVVVPLPARRSARRRRGFDQARLLAEALAAAVRLRCEAGALSRRREPRRAQAGATLAQRRALVRGAFQARPLWVSEREAVLVDDVLSTGASVDAASRALLLAGARSVTVITLAT